MRCNIDAKGKLARLIWGVALLIVGALLLIFWAHPQGGALAWTISLVVMLGGAFAVFESRAGWCVIRAMGFKTPI